MWPYQRYGDGVDEGVLRFLPWSVCISFEPISNLPPNIKYRVFFLLQHRTRQLYRAESLHPPVHSVTFAALRPAKKDIPPTVRCWKTVAIFQNCDTKHAVYVWRNIGTRSRNRSCSGKEIIITHPEWVFVALGIKHVVRMRRVVICGLFGCTTFSHIIP